MTSNSALRGALLLSLFAASAPAGALAQDRCGGSSPATPAPADLWPEGFRPAPTPLPMNRLPRDRDSTDYITQTIPGAATGHELFESVEAIDDWLFVAYNAGLQVWDVSQDRNNPRRRASRDGWLRQWLSFPGPGEADSFVVHVDATRMPGGGYLIATAGLNQVGTAIWRFDPDDGGLTQIYQSRVESSYQVAVVWSGGRGYVLAATEIGMSVYDASAAMEAPPCVDDLPNPVCPDVYLGNFAGLNRVRFVDARVVFREGVERTLVVTADGANGGDAVQLFEVSDMRRPQLARDGGAVVRRAESDIDFGYGVALFTVGRQVYLAAIDHLGGPGNPGNQINIFSIFDCLGANCALDAPVWQSEHFPTRSSRKFLRYSVDNRGTPNDVNDDEHFLYMGFDTTRLGGSNAERLYHLDDLRPRPPNAGVVQLAADGDTYRDACTDEDVGYWGWYYPRNEDGLNNFSPRDGVFVRNRFYRMGRGVFDIHVWTRPPLDPPPQPDPDMGVVDPDAGLAADAGQEPEADAGVGPDQAVDPADDAGPRADLGDGPSPDLGPGEDDLGPGEDDLGPDEDDLGPDEDDLGLDGPAPDAVVPREDGGEGQDEEEDSGSDDGCAATTSGTAPGLWILLLLAGLRRRRSTT